MAVKFQFQFAGVDLSRPSSPHRKWLRVGTIVMMSMLTALAYWGYLHHLTHHRTPLVPHIASAIPVVAVPVSPKPVVPVVPTAAIASAAPATPAAMTSTLKKVADDSIRAVGSYLMQAARISPAAPVATAVPTASAEPAAKPVPMAEPIVYTTPKAAPPRPLRIHTDQENLLMAGQKAFATAMDFANKYPDAYGFQAGDFLSEAKLGDPMPVYTIEESDRASYQAGQPVKPLLKPARQWVFPVLLGDRICCMVQVKQTGHDYVPGISNKSLAMAWSKILEKWPSEEGFHPLLVVNPDIPGYYFTVPELPQQNITDTTEMFYFHPGTSPADVILASWR